MSRQRFHCIEICSVLFSLAVAAFLFALQNFWHSFKTCDFHSLGIHVFWFGLGRSQNCDDLCIFRPACRTPKLTNKASFLQFVEFCDISISLSLDHCIRASERARVISWLASPCLVCTNGLCCSKHLGSEFSGREEHASRRCLIKNLLTAPRCSSKSGEQP